MKRYSVLATILLAAFGLGGCASMPATNASTPVAIDGQAVKLSGQRYLQYRVGINISAPADKVWALLTDAPGYPSWNSTIVKIDGTIALEEEIELTAKIDPSRTFELTVSEYEAPKKLVWGDGGMMFKGVRTFLLVPKPDGTTDVTMVEVMHGAMMGFIEGELPDFIAPFNAFAADLKKAAEGA